MVDVNPVLKSQSLPTQSKEPVSKKAATAPVQAAETKSLYEKNGLSRAYAAKYMPSVSFGASIKPSDINKLVDAFKSLDPEIQKFSGMLTDLFKNSKFQELNDSDKQICSVAALLSELAKKNGQKLENMPQEYINKASEFIKDSRSESRLNGLFKSSDFIKALDSRKDPSQILTSQDYVDYKILKDYGINFRRTGDLKIAEILMEKGLYGDYNPTVHQGSIKSLETFINRIHQGGIWIPQTKIPRASEINKAVTSISGSDGVTQNVVIDLSTDNLEKLGFAKGVTKDSFTTLGHAVDAEKFSAWMHDYVSEDGTDALLSTSFFHDAKFPTFVNRQFGFFMDAHPDNIAMADSGNMGSGFAKDFIDFKNNLINMNKQERAYFSKNFCEAMGIDKSDYPKIYNEIVNVRSIDEVSNPEVREALTKAIDKTLVNKEGSINEVVVYCPKSNALFSKAQNLEDIPFALRKYAQDKDIPIIDISKMG